MDLASFSDENFNPKDWVNNLFKSPEAAGNEDAFAASQVMKLQLFIQEVNNSLEDVSQQVLQNLPRVVRDAESIRHEASTLQEQMRIVKEDIAKVERNTAESMQTLLKIDSVKSRMQLTSKALQEADNWTTLSANVDEVFQSGDINAIGEKLVAMQQSLEILVDVPDYKERCQHLENLKNRLEALLSPQLIAAFNAQSVDAAQIYVRIFTDIQRLPELQKYYHTCHKSQLLTQWRGIIENDPDDTLTEWMPNFYDILLSSWHNQVKWCSLVFLNISPISILCELLQDVLNNLEPSLLFCIDAALKQQSNSLLYLMDLQQVTERFAKSLEVAVHSYGAGLLLAEHTHSLAAAIFSPYKAYVPKYSTYEESILLSQLENLSIECEDLADSVRLLGESVNKVFAFVNDSNNRCQQFSKGCGYFKLAAAFKSLFTNYSHRFYNVVTQLQENQADSPPAMLFDDWLLFQHILSIIQTCGELLLQTNKLDEDLMSNLWNISKKSQYLIQPEKRKDVTPFQMFDKLFLDEADLKTFHRQLTKLKEDDDPSLIHEMKAIVKKLSEKVITSLFDLLFSHIQQHLASVPTMPIWTSSSQGVLTADLPNFSMSPLEYITQIGQYLMTIPQHIEPFVLQDNPALKTALKQVKLPYTSEQDTEQVDHIADYLLGCIARGTMNKYLEAILQINEIKPHAAKQLATDIDYLCNVLDDLGLKVIDNFQSFLVLLKASAEEYQTVAEGKPPRIVSIVRSMRGLRIM